MNDVVSRHSRAFILLALAVSILSLRNGATSFASHPAVWALALALGGLPHGALDWWLGRRWLRPQMGRTWAVWFAALYLAVAGGVLLAAAIAPRVTLCLFLLSSAWHFGQSDAATSESRRLAVLERVARGFLPLSMPALAWPASTADLLSALVDRPFAISLVGIGQAIGPFILLAVGIYALVTWRSTDSPARSVRPSAEMVAVAALGLLTPPLTSFALYFCLLHSPRHVFSMPPLPPGVSRASFLGRTSLLVFAVVLVALGVIATLAPSRGLEASVFVTAVWGLAALATPHMLLLEAIAAMHRAPRPAPEEWVRGLRPIREPIHT